MRSIEQVVLATPLVDVRLVRSDAESISASASDHGTVIEWTNHQHGWERVIGLLGPLAEFGCEGKSGHQYLTSPDVRILVELALLE